MITWKDYKNIVSQQLAAAADLRFGHPLDPELPISISPDTIDKDQLQKLLEEACRQIENGFSSHWSETEYFLVGRLALEQRLNAGPDGHFWRYLLADGLSFWAKVQEAVILETFPAEISLSLINLFVGPVQEFIQEARKVRDLWAGSFLLAAATFQALTPILRKFGPDVVIHPHLLGTIPFYQWVTAQCPDHALSAPAPDLTRLASLPNRALALVPTDQVEEIGGQAQKQLKEYWAGQAGKVWARLSAARQLAITDTIWDQQIQDHFHCYYTAVPVSRETLIQGYAAAQAEAQNLFEARKLTRSFPFWPTPDFRSKCTLCNHREILGPGARGKSRRFWEDFVRNSRGQLRPGEQLCASCLSKRLLRDADLGVPRFAFDSTCDIAIRGYRDEITRTDHGDFLVAMDQLREQSGQEREFKTIFDIPGEWFFKENLENKRFLQSIAADQDLAAEGDLIAALELAREELANLQKTVGPSPAYYAVLMLDGDEMGKWMSGAKPDPVRLPLTLARHVSLSQVLTILAREVMPALLDDWPGVLVYAGGDDLLALGPVKGVLPAAQRLQTGFREGLPAQGLLGFGPEASISAGLVLAHHHDSLEMVLETAREAERQAKDSLGRNALQIVIRFSAGSAVCGGYKWLLPLASRTKTIPLTDFLLTLAAWTELPDKGISPRFLYRVMDTLPVFAPPVPGHPIAQEPLAAELNRVLKRHLPADSPLWTVQDPFSPEELLELLLVLAQPLSLGPAPAPDFKPLENLQGLFKIALFLAREQAC